MTDLRQIEINIEAINEQHIACVLLLDTSGSMQGEPIKNLNQGIKEFKDQSMLDNLAKKRIDVATVAFNSTAQVIQEFVPLPQMNTPELEASGTTAMGAALNLAMDLIDKRKALYKELGTPYFRPWIFMITDGAPTDDYTAAAKKLVEWEEKKKVMFWAVGVPGYEVEVLKKITPRIIELQGINFVSIFEWLSSSMVAVSNSNIDDKLDVGKLPDEARVIPSEWLK